MNAKPRIVGYCSSCDLFHRHDEIPIHGTRRFGVCELGHPGPMCADWKPTPTTARYIADEWAEKGIGR